MKTNYKIDPNYGMYFITSTVINWVPIIINEEFSKIILQSFKFCQSKKKLFIYGFVIMPNHFHMLISMEDPKKIPFVVRDLKRHTSQEISKLLADDTGKKHLPWLKSFYGKKISNVWQEGYHPVLIKSKKWFLQKLDYVHLNPVRKGFVERPEYWKYSSARNYILEDDSLIKLDLDQL